MSDSHAGVWSVITIVLIVLGIGLLLWINPFVSIDSQQIGIVTKFGKIEGTMSDGLHTVNPFTTDVVKLDASNLKEEADASAASKDLQMVTTKVALNYQIDRTNAIELYREFRKDYVGRLIQPAIQEAIKSATAKYTAEELITKREEVKGVMFLDLKNRLQSHHIDVTELMITNFDFSQEFNNAIEAKVKAEQDAQKAQNDLARVQFEAQQRIEQAKAEAEAIRIQAEAVTSQGGADYVKLKAIEKWNGNVPTTMIPGASVPFINLNN